MSDYSTIMTALHTRLGLIPGIAVVLDYEPKSVQVAPLMYSLLESFTREQSGQIVTMKYRTLHRLVIQWQDNEQAEGQLRSFVPLIPAWIEADQQLGGTIPSGFIRCTDAATGFLAIGGTDCRICDFYTEAIVKVAKGTEL